MNTAKNTGDNNSVISITELKPDNLEDYLKVDFDAFSEKIKLAFGNDKEAALNIMRTEIAGNINNNRHYIARIRNKIVGIIEIVSSENIKTYIRDLRVYVKYLGFLKALRAFIISLFENPKLNSKTVYIDTVAVEPGHRRKGVAEKMLAFIENLAGKNGKKALTLWVAARNNNALNLYKKFGFTVSSKKSSWIAERYTGYRDWLYMKKEIS